MKMVLVIRNDLNMRKGKMAAQAGHAVQELLIDRSTNPPTLRTDPFVLEWLADNYRKITVRVDSEAELLALHARATELNIPVSLILDNGHTEFHGQQTYTAVALGPVPDEVVDPLTGTLKLL